MPRAVFDRVSYHVRLCVSVSGGGKERVGSSVFVRVTGTSEAVRVGEHVRVGLGVALFVGLQVGGEGVTAWWVSVSVRVVVAKTSVAVGMSAGMRANGCGKGVKGVWGGADLGLQGGVGGGGGV